MRIINSTGHDLKYDNIIRAQNCTLFDDSGNSYLDLESGIWCTPLGHCHPRITRVISEQSAKMIHSGYCYLNPVMDEAASQILDITGIVDGKCVFLCSGSEAVEYSVKLCRSIFDKPYFLTMKNCYLSAYGISGERPGNEWIEYDWQNDDSIDRIDFSKIAAFVFEPGSSLGLVNFPPKDLVLRIVDRVRDNGGIVIANEVTTGMGRTGKWFGYQHYDIVPDIVAIGKGLGNGYPVSCAAVSDKVLSQFDPHKFHYAQSHQNDPLGATVANEVIRIIKEDNLLDRCAQTGVLIYKRLLDIQERYGVIKEIRGRGLMLAIEFMSCDRFSVAEVVNDKLLEKNIILTKRPGHEVLRFDPALTIELSDIDYYLDNLENIIRDISRSANL